MNCVIRRGDGEEVAYNTVTAKITFNHVFDAKHEECFARTKISALKHVKTEAVGWSDLANMQSSYSAVVLC